MGVGGTCHAALGRAAMSVRTGFSCAALAAAALAAAVSVSGCSSIGAASGAAAGVATGVVTSNPAIGIGVGIAVQAATDEVVKRVMKSMHTDQQVAIAYAAGMSGVGETRPWRVDHTLPVENGHGDVRVLREFSSALATCKEFAFSVANGETAGAHQDWFLATACKQDVGWRWASAEPAVERWGNLQ
jgi:hypothetical protein